MRKLLLLFLLFFCSNVGAKDTLAAAKKDKIVFTLKDIKIDTSDVVSKTFPVNLKKKYNSAPFVYEYKTPEKNAWDRFKEWLANMFKNLFRFSSNKASMHFVGILLKVMAVLIVVFVIFLIVKSVMNKEGQWIFGKNSDKKIIHYNEIEKNLHSVDFETLIQNTLQSGEQRLSIRYYYLWLLKRMSEKQLIAWDIEKTNSDYLHELKSQSRKDEFGYLSYLYNYIWYGEFELDEETFAKAKKAFEHSIKSVSNE